MKKLFLALAIFASVTMSAQVSKVTLQASGLTCSMCSNSITKALKTLPYAESVFANIQSSSFDINIKPGSNVSFDEIKKKVEDAGFFVANMKATMNFDNQPIVNNEHINVSGLTLHFLNVKDQTLKGNKSVQILDKGYVSAKAFKKNEIYTKMDCYKTGVAGSCCSKGGLTTGTRIYHVTI
jgi:copper chaperone CopZ